MVPVASPSTRSTRRARTDLTWTRPELGLIEFNGSKRNNIVLEGDGAHNLAPFRDRNPAATGPQRYKAVGSGVRDRKPVLYGFVSPDGLRWSKIREEPIVTDGKFDSPERGLLGHGPKGVRGQSTGISSTACEPSSRRRRRIS